MPSWCNSDSRSLPPALHKFGFQPKLVLQIFDRGTCLSRLFDNPNNGVTAFDRPLSNHVIDFSGSAKGYLVPEWDGVFCTELHPIVPPKYFVSCGCRVRCENSYVFKIEFHRFSACILAHHVLATASDSPLRSSSSCSSGTRSAKMYPQNLSMTVLCSGRSHRRG